MKKTEEASKKEAAYVFDYFYGSETEQFSFYRIPKLLFTDDHFKKLSSDSKILYGLMLDRSSLSQKNDWVDDQGRVFIIYTVKAVQEDIHVASEKATKMLKELEEIGLIERKKRGQGKPSIIFVKNFATVVKPQNFEHRNSRISKNETSEFRNSKNSNFDYPDSEISESERQDIRKSNSSNTDKNNTDTNKTNLSTNQQNGVMDGLMDGAHIYVLYKKILEENVDLNLFQKKREQLDKRMDEMQISFDEYDDQTLEIDPGRVEKVIGYMLDVLCSNSTDDILINGEAIPREIVKSKLVKTDFMQMKAVVRELNTNGTIKNPKAYSISMLYNS